MLVHHRHVVVINAKTNELSGYGRSEKQNLKAKHDFYIFAIINSKEVEN
jgi:hypothetical protein